MEKVMQFLNYEGSLLIKVSGREDAYPGDYNMMMLQAKLEMTGGAFASTCSGSVQQEANAQGVFCDDYSSAVIFSDFLNLKGNLTEDELRAVILHEIGHIKKGHIFEIEKADKNKGVIHVAEFEYEADEYAVERGVAPQVLRSALTKIALFTVETKTKGKIKKESFLAKLIFRFLLKKDFRSRLQKLKSMERTQPCQS